MTRRKTNEEFLKQLYYIVGDEYTPLEEYINNRTKIKVKHNTCGNIYFVSPDKVLLGRKCPQCSRKKTHKKFENEINELVGDEYKVLGKYEGSNTKIEILHMTCNRVYSTTPAIFLSGYRCPHCSCRRKRNTEEIKSMINDLVGDEYELISETNGLNHKITLKHSVCDHVFSPRAIDFISKGSRCPKCYGNIKKTHNEFIEEIYNLVGDEYSVIDTYKGSNEYIHIKYNTCGYIYKMKPNCFLRGNRCYKCSGLMRKTDEEFKKVAYEILGETYKILGYYESSKKTIKIIHTVCGWEYESTPYSILKGSKCPRCEGKNAKRDTDLFKLDVYNTVGSEYEVVGQYKTANEYILMKHTTCGYSWEVKPGAFIYGSRCSNCSTNKKRTHDEFIKEVYELYKDEYIILSEYVDRKTPIKIKHNTCGHIWNTTSPASLLNGTRCPKYFVMSKGESTILKYCEINNINFRLCFNKMLQIIYTITWYQHLLRYKVSFSLKFTLIYSDINLFRNQHTSKTEPNFQMQVKFKGCKNVHELPYDIAIYDHSNALYMLIEYQGEQHYKPRDYFGGEDAFKRQKINDQIKREYCKLNEIKLLEIPYWEYNNIEKILDKELKNLLLDDR